MRKRDCAMNAWTGCWASVSSVCRRSDFHSLSIMRNTNPFALFVDTFDLFCFYALPSQQGNNNIEDHLTLRVRKWFFSVCGVVTQLKAEKRLANVFSFSRLDPLVSSRPVFSFFFRHSTSFADTVLRTFDFALGSSSSFTACHNWRCFPSLWFAPTLFCAVALGTFVDFYCCFVT